MKNKYIIIKTLLSLLLMVNLSVMAESGLYETGYLNSNRAAALPALKASGFTYLIFFNIQVEPNGSLTIGGDTLCSNGVYKFAVKHPYYASDLASLKTGTTSIRRIEQCIGGWLSPSYGNIKTLINTQGTGPNSTLYKNFQALKNAIPAIDAIDNDQEDTYDYVTTIAFHVMLADIGFKTSIAPYMNLNWWQYVATQINAQRPGTIDRVYVQCYAGGQYNNPKDWNINNITLHAGVWSWDSSDSIKSKLTRWKKTSKTVGGFIWPEHGFNSIKSYASDINGVFGGGDVVNVDKMKPYLTVYSDCNYQGTSANFEKGNYTIAGIEVQGFANKTMSSLKLAPGFRVRLYNGSNCIGQSYLITESVPCFDNPAINDSISSWVVQPNGDTNLSNKILYLKNRKSGKFMSVANESSSNSSLIQQKEYTGKEDQKWVFISEGYGVYRLKNRKSNKVMQVCNSSIDDGANLEQYTDLSIDNQRFIIKKNETSDYYKIIPYLSTKYLKVDNTQIDVSGANVIQGGNITDQETDWELISMYGIMKPHAILYSNCSYLVQGINFEVGNYTSASMSLFGMSDNALSSIKVTPGFKATLYDADNVTGTSLLELATSNSCLSDASFDNKTTSLAIEPNGATGFNDVYYLQNRNSSLYMSLASESDQDGINIEQKAFSGNDSQKWTLTDLGDGVYKLINVKSGKAAGVVSGVDSANIQQGTYADKTVQKFVLYPGETPNYYRLVSYESGHLMDVKAASTVECANIQLGANQNQISAEWKLVNVSGAGIGKNHIYENLHIYPNPVNNLLFIDHVPSNMEKTIITDLQGQKIMMQNGNINPINVSGLTAGMYFIAAYFKGEQRPYVSKFVKFD